MGADRNGTFVSFTLPSFDYWTMVVLETNSAADGDFHVNAFGTVRGANFNEASNGIAADRTVANGACCGRWARYAGVEFGDASPVSVALLCGASAASTLTFRLDGVAGPVVVRWTLPAKGGPGATRTSRCPVSRATGLHDLFVTFDGGAISFYNFAFAA